MASLIQWVPGHEHAFRGQMDDCREAEVDGYSHESEWFGENGYDPGSIFWLQLQMNGEKKKAILRAYKGPKLLDITVENEEDAISFLGFDGFISEPTEDHNGVILWPC